MLFTEIVNNLIAGICFNSAADQAVSFFVGLLPRSPNKGQMVQQGSKTILLSKHFTTNSLAAILIYILQLPSKLVCFRIIYTFNIFSMMSQQAGHYIIYKTWMGQLWLRSTIYKIYYKIVTLWFGSLVIRLRSDDLKHLIPTPVSRVSFNPSYV